MMGPRNLPSSSRYGKAGRSQIRFSAFRNKAARKAEVRRSRQWFDAVDMNRVAPHLKLPRNFNLLTEIRLRFSLSLQLIVHLGDWIGQYELFLLFDHAAGKGQSLLCLSIGRRRYCGVVRLRRLRCNRRLRRPVGGGGGTLVCWLRSRG